MKVTILLDILLISLSNLVYSQTQVFKGFDFEEGGYCLLGTYMESDRNSLKDSLGWEFYTDDVGLLNQFKQEWVFTEPGKHYACGYHYKIQLCRNGKSLKQLVINLNCNEIVTDEGYFYFDNDKLRMFYGKLKKPRKEKELFKNINEARACRDSILKKESLIVASNSNWTKFEGKFDFTYKCDETKKTCSEKKDSLKVVIENTIRATYPNEEFELHERGGSLTTIDLIIYCNKSLSDKFDLFYRDDEYFGGWKRFRLSLTTYWK